LDNIAPLFRLFSDLDLVRISRLARRHVESNAPPPRAIQAIDEGESVPPVDVPPDVITMNSRFVLQNDDDEEKSLTLCYPEQADYAAGFISVMSPLGGELLGRRVGERFSWDEGASRTIYHIVRLSYQPEASGDYGV